MKRIHYFFLCLLSALCSLPASAVTVTLKVNNADQLTCQVNYQDYTLKNGDNVITADEYNSIYVNVKNSSYWINSVRNGSGTAVGNNYGTSWIGYLSSYDDGQIWTMDVINLDQNRLDSFTINVDDPSMVRVLLPKYNRSLSDLKAGQPNVIKFDAAAETNLSIEPTNYLIPLYKVTLNGSPVNPSGSSYQIVIDDGDVVDITAVIPDKDIQIDFSYSEDGLGAIKSVAVDDATVAGFNGLTLSCKAGKKVSLTANPAYKIEEIKINGSVIYWSGSYPYDFYPVDNTSISVTAHPYGNISFTVKVDDPANIRLYNGSYAGSGNLINLTAGDNTVELREDNANIAWEAAPGAIIDEVKVNGNVLSYSSSTTAEKNMVIEFTTHKIVYDMQAVVWIDKKEAAENYFSFQSNNRTNIDLVNGYNVIDFYEQMAPFGLSWYGAGATVAKVYINDELVNPMYEGSTSYEMPLTNGSVAKIFLATEPQTCTVNFTVPADVSINVTRDVIVPVTDYSAGVTCLNGTQFILDGEQISSVKVNDSPIAAKENGRYVFTVENPTTTVVVEASNVGIDAIGADESADEAVYTLTGVRAGSRADIKSLAPGIYVVAGKKIVVK